MHPFYEVFVSSLIEADKEACVSSVLDQMDNNRLDIPTLYMEILAPALNHHFCQSEQELLCIWEEHIRSSIIRTIIECCYPYVIRERDQKLGGARKGRVVVVCPTQELHELGARMVADFFTLAGFDTAFVGANTPQDEIIEGIGRYQPDYVCISVTASFNLVAARRTMQHILDVRSRWGSDFKVVVGGHAFYRNPELARELGADLHVTSLEQIHQLGEKA